MRILVIVHLFPPRNMGGTEVYAYKLAKALQARGHDVHVYYADQPPGRANYEVRRLEYDGLPCIEVVNHYDYKCFRDTYKNEAMEARLAAVLDELRPDVVHVQHLYLHSVGYIGLATARGIPVVYTLAEYFNICPRNGWLARLDFALCDGPSPAECARCSRALWPPPAAEPPGAAAPQPSAWGAWIRGAPSVLASKTRARLAAILAPPPADARTVYVGWPWPRYSLRRFVRKVRVRLASALHHGPGAIAPVPGFLDPYIPAVERRWREIKEELDRVDLFVAPSRFLREQFVKTGMVEPDRIAYSDYGFDRTPFAGRPRPAPRAPGAPLRVGFIGNIKDAKGVHVLVDAFNELPEQGVECKIYGDLGMFSDYAADLRRRRKNPVVRFLGAYDNQRIADVLGEMDVIVVPSIWFENSPLTIHEAFLAGVPVVTGDRGGMAELVGHEVNGLHFRIGDARDLRVQLQRLLDEPGLLERLRQGMPPVKDIADDAREMEERFLQLLRGRSRAGQEASCASPR